MENNNTKKQNVYISEEEKTLNWDEIQSSFKKTFGTEVYNSWLQKISLVNPIYWMISGLRYSTLSIEEVSNVMSLSLCLIFSTIFTIIASYLFKIGYKIKS